MLISGRIHGAVQGLSQTIPTLVMNYGHEPKAHKLKGFATIYGINEYLVAPDNLEQLMNKTNKLWNNRVNYVKNLNEMLINVKSNSLENFELLRSNLF
jgi:colanic acid/amylovoran biosynthesis protein